MIKILTSYLSEQYFEKQKTSSKKKVLIFCSDLRRNGITTSLLNLMQLTSSKEIEYYFTFREESLSDDPTRLSLFCEYKHRLPNSPLRRRFCSTDTICSFEYPRIKSAIKKGSLIEDRNKIPIKILILKTSKMRNKIPIKIKRKVFL